MNFPWEKSNSQDPSLVAVPDICRKVLIVARLRFEAFCVVFAYAAGAGAGASANVSSLVRSEDFVLKGGVIAELEM